MITEGQLLYLEAKVCTTNLVAKFVIAAVRLDSRDPNRDARTQLVQIQTEPIHAIPWCRPKVAE
jgi:hypothetical protein